MTENSHTTPISITYTVNEDTFMRACNALWTHKALGSRGIYIAAAGVFVCAGYLIVAANTGVFPYVLLAIVTLAQLLDIAMLPFLPYAHVK